MLPFTTKVTHQLVERLCRITAQNEPQDIDVDVDIHVHSREIHHLFTTRSSTSRDLGSEVLNDAQEQVYEAFITFLQSIAQPEVFLPVNLLNRYPQRLYCLLMSPNRSREMFEIYNKSAGDRLTYSDYELVVNSKPQILDTEAYLIAPNKYTLFMRQVNESRAINVYRSDFIDLVTNTPPPFNLHAQDIIDTLQNTVATEPVQPIEGQQLLMFPPYEEKEEMEKVTECPECGGAIQKIGVGKYFCLDCEWDNLPPLR